MNSKSRLLNAHVSVASSPGDGACGFFSYFTLSLAMASALFMLTACGKEANNIDIPSLTIYSPAPPTTALHEHNVELGDALNACQIQNSVVAMALPQSINQIGAMDESEKPYHLPIVTTIDFLPAVTQGGPAWHAYDKANGDLKFVAALYDVAFGVLVFDRNIQSPDDLKGKKIGAPPQPSAVRVYTEALFRDGWGILDDVEIVDMRPPDLPAAVANKEIAATTWNLISMSADQRIALAPQLLEQDGAHWISVDDATTNAINGANDFKIEISEIDPGHEGGARLLSFRQALAAWAATPDETVNAILQCLEKAGAGRKALPDGASEMAHWPHLSAENIHGAALNFYRERGVALD